MDQLYIKTCCHVGISHEGLQHSESSSLWTCCNRQLSFASIRSLDGTELFQRGSSWYSHLISSYSLYYTESFRELRYMHVVNIAAAFHVGPPRYLCIIKLLASALVWRMVYCSLSCVLELTTRKIRSDLQRPNDGLVDKKSYGCSPMLPRQRFRTTLQSFNSPAVHLQSDMLSLSTIRLKRCTTRVIICYHAEVSAVARDRARVPMHTLCFSHTYRHEHHRYLKFGSRITLQAKARD